MTNFTTSSRFKIFEIVFRTYILYKLHRIIRANNTRITYFSQQPKNFVSEDVKTETYFLFAANLAKQNYLDVFYWTKRRIIQNTTVPLHILNWREISFFSAAHISVPLAGCQFLIILEKGWVSNCIMHNYVSYAVSFSLAYLWHVPALAVRVQLDVINSNSGIGVYGSFILGCRSVAFVIRSLLL